jgi:hypothetical protein
VTTQDIVVDALRELGVLNAVDPPTGEDAELGLFRLNKLLDNLNAEQRSIYASTVTSYTLTPSLQPHTIGDGGTFDTAQRPESIEGANLVIDGIRHPIELRDAQWRMGLSTPALESAIPTDLYYEKAWPLGKVWLYPVPSSADSVELLTRVVLASLALADDFTLPPGYQDAITLTLAEDLSVPFRVQVPQSLTRLAQKARGRVWTANSSIPRLRTADFGLGGARSTWDYRTGRY